MTVCGALILTDWQAIPYDPCTELSPFHHPNIVANYSETGTSDSTNEVVNTSLAVHLQILQVLAEDQYTIAVRKCENANITKHTCHWIPNSVITKKHCGDCQPICRSLQQSLTFAQYCIGATAITMSIDIVSVPVATLLSDRIGRSNQVKLLYLQQLQTMMSTNLSLSYCIYFCRDWSQHF